MVSSESTRLLDEGVVDVLVEPGCLVRLLGPFAFVGQTGLLFLAIGGVWREGYRGG